MRLPLKLEAAIEEMEQAARPFVEYYKKLRAWDGGCALPEKPAEWQCVRLEHALECLEKARKDSVQAQLS